MKFPYRKVPLSTRSAFFGNALLKSIIPVTVQYEGHGIRYEALIDSGADFNIFHAEIGQAIGIDVKRGTRISFGGIQALDGAEGFFHDVTLVIGGHEVETRVAFSSDIASWGYGVLGQRGFFDAFHVTFDYQKSVIELKIPR